MNAPTSPVQRSHPSPAPTTPGQRLLAALRVLRWSYGTLAVVLGLSASTTRNWGLGRSPVPGEVLAWVETLASFHAAHPPP